MTDNPYPSRKKMRFTGFDYKTQGCYFITVVTFNRSCLFGHVENEEMILSDSGKMIDHIYHTIEEVSTSWMYGLRRDAQPFPLHSLS